MKTVGEILKEARQKKGLTFVEIEKATKIRVHFLEDLEKNDFTKVAEGTIVKGLIKNYAEFLGLSSGDLLAILRRDFIEDKKGQILPKGVYEPVLRPKLVWTPQLTIILLVATLFLVFLFYLAFQFSSLFGAPSLEIKSPKEGEVFTTEEVKIMGKTTSDATVLVNGEMALVSPEGSFEKTITLSPGENKIKIEAVSRRGKKTEKEINLKFENP